MTAATAGHASMVELLLDRGAEMDMADNVRQLLQFVLKRMYRETCRLLLQSILKSQDSLHGGDILIVFMFMFQQFAF
jgi:hypothetical protein